MTATYELWEIWTGNLMDSFDSRDEALALLGDAIKRYGPSYTDSILLVYAHGGESRELTSGKDLADWAMNPNRWPGYPGPEN